MSGDHVAQVLYLALLGAAVLGWFVAHNRASWGKVTQQAVIWALIFLGAIAAVGLWGDIRRTALSLPEISEDRVEIPRGADGHYHLTLQVNGTPVAFVVDTGATNIVLSRADAAHAGIDVAALRFLGTAYTANGPVRTARVVLDSIALGGMRDTGVPAYVNGGDHEGSLLGMDYLQRFPEITIRGDRMILAR